jgi:hypothetical protein
MTSNSQANGQAACKQPTKSGGVCKGRRLHGSDYCRFHHPDFAEQRTEARRKGGKTRSRPRATLADFPEKPLKTVGDVTELLSLALNKTIRGELDCKVANSVAVLGNVLLRCIAGSELEEKWAELQRQMAEVRGHVRENAAAGQPDRDGTCDLDLDGDPDAAGAGGP